MQLNGRLDHAKQIFVTWWSLIYGVMWGFLCSADVIVAHYASSSFKAKWNAEWLAPKWGWRTTLIGFGILTVGLVFEKSFCMVREARLNAEQRLVVAKQEYAAKEQALDKQIEDLKSSLDVFLASKPNITSEFAYADQQAFLAVTNNGPSAKVWASLSVKGLGRGVGPFARWSHSSSYKVRIGKGETCNLLLASLKIEGSMSQWVVGHATESGVGIAEAMYSSLVWNKDGQAPDVDMYVTIFSDPDCIELPKDWHIVLHSHVAEVGD
jgi:hypothetical protein